MSRRRASPEQGVHRSIIAHLRVRGVPGLVFIHPANGGRRSPVEGAVFKSLGVRAGASDLLLWHAGNSYALELKAPGGRATEQQLAFLADMDRAGAFTCLAEGLDHAVATLEQWGLLIGRASA